MSDPKNTRASLRVSFDTGIRFEKFCTQLKRERQRHVSQTDGLEELLSGYQRINTIPPVNSSDLRQSPDRKVLDELLTSFHTISKISTQGADALGKLVESLSGTEVEIVPEDPSNASTDEQITELERDLEGIKADTGTSGPGNEPGKTAPRRTGKTKPVRKQA